jgi:hypothetical protein
MIPFSQQNAARSFVGNLKNRESAMHRQKPLVTAALVTVAYGIWAIAGYQPDTSQAESEKAKAPAQVEVQQIPLSEIYATSDQKGLRGSPYSARSWLHEFAGVGASNVFLVCGNDINGAVGATSLVIRGGRPADIPALPHDGTGANRYWLVAYLGVAGSDPPAWLVRSADVSGKTIRLRYHVPRRGASTSDCHPYFVWVPIGELQRGIYTLQLIDTDTNEAHLSRRVTVSAK